MTYSPIEARYQAILERVHSAANRSGRSASDITLVAVSKRQPEQAIDSLVGLGHRDFGENMIQEWQRKAKSFAHVSDLRWHVIGPVQTNKAKFIERCPPHRLHTVDRPALVEALERRLGGSTILNVLIQVNMDEEPQKAGVLPKELRAMADRVTASPSLSLKGLMCIPAKEGHSRATFARMRSMGEELHDRIDGPCELSMGMSSDFEDAIAEGATIVRVGSALFGHRSG